MKNIKFQEYVEADRAEKAAKSRKEAVKGYLQRYLRRCKRWDIPLFGFRYSESSTVTIKEEEVFEYIKDLCKKPKTGEDGKQVYVLDEELFNKFCKQVIDVENLKEIAKELKMKVLPLPAQCYTISESKKITVEHKKLEGNQ